MEAKLKSMQKLAPQNNGFTRLLGAIAVIRGLNDFFRDFPGRWLLGIG
uniref:Serine carboxypeptidase-like 20 isoform X1 n=1 Tax=Rhizophora mucronata TaxID=61149 RepID=A0A2P2NPB8_RHIMU